MVRNIVFEGGGVKGVAYAGALVLLEEEEMINRVCGYGGTSAGAITAVLCSVGYTAEEIKRIIWQLNFNDFKDDSFGVIRDTSRLISEFGWYKGDYFIAWLSKIVASIYKSDPTFKEVYDEKGVDLRLIGSNLSTRRSEVFSCFTTPDMSIILAARISMSIPLFFTAVEYDNCLYVDGGLYRNYPIEVFDRDYPKGETLGMRLDSSEEIKRLLDPDQCDIEEIIDFESYLTSLVNSLMSVQEDRHLRSNDWKRTVYIDTGDISTIDFDLTEKKKDFLFSAGYNGANKFITSMDNR